MVSRPPCLISLPHARSHREPASLDLVDAVAGALQERVGAAPESAHDEEAQRLMRRQHLHSTRQPALLPSAALPVLALAQPPLTMIEVVRQFVRDFRIPKIFSQLEQPIQIQ
jgi:hypothetical protein